MKSILGVSALMLLIASAYAAELPGASADGKRLHDANCMGCHDTGILTRKERLVQSLDALKKRWATVVISQKSENAVKLS
jgi:cytochrome c5